MNLQFNDLAELSEFMSFVGFVRQTPSPMQAATPVAGADFSLPAIPAETTDKPAAPAANGADTAAPEEKGTRKRRTKAEIEADKLAAEAEKIATESEATAGATDKSAGEHTTDAADAEVDSPPKKSTDPVAYVAAALTLVPEVAQVDHLVKARAFIAKHGMAKYTETQALVGLGANVMAYTKADCAAHVAAMDFVLQS
jgi:hypothetical protein